MLLFAGLAFFAFAQAASARNGAQTAADAAALGAAQSARDDLVNGLLLALQDGDDWLRWLDGDGDLGVGAPSAAQALAAENGATVTAGPQATSVRGFPAFRVAVQMASTVGDSVIPGTEGMRAKATATAVIEPRCAFDADAKPDEAVELDCDGQTVTIDPQDFEPDDLPDGSDLFSVYLAE
ncbi:pilus assembly protein TadG-related protein [Streptomyces fragilis]|uniref:Pilus assembly protein TadG-related protein n=1 Tax=Streptomyces fragilis TaxID=67301 RepID=A0ABV2YEL0_9ACTN